MMRRIFHCPGVTLVLLPALLYGCSVLFASTAVRAAEVTAREPHIALLLPLASPSFGRHAEAVRQGFVAAANAAGKGVPPIRVYSVNEDTLNILASYEQAIESGALLVVGPLTRNGVAAVAASNLVTVPTLALNTLDARGQQPSRMYFFGLGAEQEARQVARLALDVSRRNAYIVSDNTPVSKRMRQAFVEELARRGGRVVADFQYGTDPQSLAKLRDAAALGAADMLFLALDSARARAVRPYLGNALPLYATSQVNAIPGAPVARELNLVYFVEMPWLLQADHPAVMIYPRAQFGDAIDLERLYALGIDALRIGLELLRNTPDPSLDGVTGQIRLTPNQVFVRELPAAQFIDGKTVVLGISR
jgi:outer membrane PBP1 activator LpoA protein